MSGLKELIEENGGVVTGNPYRTYPKHEYEDKLWRWFHELEERFPCEIECDFIAVSPQITSYHAKAYWRTNPSSQFIRVAEWFVDSKDDERIKLTLLHEMVHLYTYQKGFARNVTDSSVIFKWLCGQVGTTVNAISTGSSEWQQLAVPFIEQQMSDDVDVDDDWWAFGTGALE